MKNISHLTENDGVPGSKFVKDPDNYTVEQLKRWLKCRSLKQSGKRSELLTRVRECISSGNHCILDARLDAGQWYDAKVLKENSKTCGSKDAGKIPVIPDSGWKNFPSQDVTLQFNYGHVSKRGPIACTYRFLGWASEMV